jgi:IS30 family transposase
MRQTRYQGLSGSERSEISILLQRGCSLREIAKALGRSPNTVSYELRKNSANGVYDPLRAKQKSRASRRSRRFQWQKIEQNKALRGYIIAGLKAGWNPDEISGCMKREGQPFDVGKTIIYDWLYSARGQPYCQYLPSKRYRPKHRKEHQTERVMIQDRTSITERPEAVEDRNEAGHWEGDTVVSGKRTRSKTALAVVQERTTRLIGATLIPNLKPESFTGATNRMLTGKQALTLSLDNGIENKQHTDISDATGVLVFFCDPYSSYQKGGVENANKMLRRYLPKGCDLGKFT